MGLRRASNAGEFGISGFKRQFVSAERQDRTDAGLGRRQSGHHQEQRLAAPSDFGEALVESGVGAGFRWAFGTAGEFKCCCQDGALGRGIAKPCQRYGFRRVEQGLHGPGVAAAPAEHGLPPARGIGLAFEQQDSQSRRAGFEPSACQVAEPTGQGRGLAGGVVDHHQGRGVPVPKIEVALLRETCQFFKCNEPRLPIGLRRPLAKLERQPCFAGPGLTGDHAHGYRRFPVQPGLQVVKVRLPA